MEPEDDPARQALQMLEALSPSDRQFLDHFRALKNGLRQAYVRREVYGPGGEARSIIGKTLTLDEATLLALARVQPDFSSIQRMISSDFLSAVVLFPEHEPNVDHLDGRESEAPMPSSIEDKLTAIYAMQSETEETLERTARLREENSSLSNKLLRRLVDSHPDRKSLKQKLGL